MERHLVLVTRRDDLPRHQAGQLKIELNGLMITHVDNGMFRLVMLGACCNLHLSCRNVGDGVVTIGIRLSRSQSNREHSGSR